MKSKYPGRIPEYLQHILDAIIRSLRLRINCERPTPSLRRNIRRLRGPTPKLVIVNQ